MAAGRGVVGVAVPAGSRHTWLRCPSERGELVFGLIRLVCSSLPRLTATVRTDPGTLPDTALGYTRRGKSAPNR